MMAEQEKWKIGWGYTSICNMKCPFCYSRSIRNTEEIGLDKAKRFIDENARSIDSINFGTGESFLSDNWFKLVFYIRNHHPQIRLAVTTNGTLSHSVHNGPMDHADIYKAVDEVDVSLDFASQEKHNRMRGNDNAYRWVLDTLEYCANTGITATIVFVGLEDTLQTANMKALFELASKYEAFVRMNILRPVPGNPLKPPSYRTLMQALRWILENHNVVSLCDPLFGSIYNSPDVKKEATGRTSLRILSNGMVTPSTYLISKEWWGGNITDGFILSEAAGNKAFEQIGEAPVPAECESCTVAGTCRGGAIDRRILHYNSLYERDPYCPKRNNEDLPAYVKITMASSAAQPTVHDGYLPTLIFAPGRTSDAGI